MLKNYVNLIRKLAKASLLVVILHYILEYLSSHNEFTFSVLRTEHKEPFIYWAIGIFITHFAFSLIWMSLSDDAQEYDLSIIRRIRGMIKK